MIQEADARHIARLIERGEPDIEPVEPLYDEEDVAKVARPDGRPALPPPQAIAPGRRADLPRRGPRARAARSSSWTSRTTGRRCGSPSPAISGATTCRSCAIPEVPTGVECLLTESTYGDRLHAPIEQMGEELAAVVRRTRERGGKIVIPSFALERAQEVVYELKLLRAAGPHPAAARLRRFAADREADRHLPAAPRVLRRRGARRCCAARIRRSSSRG